MSADDVTIPTPQHPRHVVALVRHAKIDEIPLIIKALKAEGCGNIFLRSIRFPYFGTLVVLTEDIMDKMEGKVLYTKNVTRTFTEESDPPRERTEVVAHDQVLELFKMNDKDLPPVDRSDRALYLSTLPYGKDEPREINHEEIRGIMNNLTRRGVIPNGSWKIHRFPKNTTSLQIRFSTENPVQIAALARIFLGSVSHTRVQWSRT